MKARKTKTINETESMETPPCHPKTGGPLPGQRAHRGRRISAFRSTATRVLALAVLGQAFFGVTLIPNARAMGPDNWIAIGDGIMGANGPVIDMVTDETGTVYVAGNFTVIGDVVANRIAKWDGKAWSPLDSGMDDQVVTLAIAGSDLYAGGVFTTAGGLEANRIARWDGSGWSALDSGMVGTEVSELAVMGGTLFAGGLFSDAGGVEVRNIAQWDGFSWSALGSGVTSWVSAMAVEGSNLYVGGRFTQAGEMVVQNMARWDGAAWSSMGFSAGAVGTPQVRCLKIWGNHLYVGGFFQNAGTVDGDFIAKWDGASWSSVGTGLNDEVRTMAATSDALYIGGNFTSAGGVPANHGAKWDGTAWSALGPGTSESLRDGGIAVRTLAVWGDRVLAGGDFAQAGDRVVNHVAAWDGSTWSPVGSDQSFPAVIGPDEDLYARKLAVDGNHIYVGGNFARIGELEVNGIVQWNGTEWSALGSGLGPDLNIFGGRGIGGFQFQPPTGAMAMSGADLYVSGNFTMAGGHPANRIAKWDGDSWSPLGDGLNSPAFVLAAAGSGLYAGGDQMIVRWDGSQWSSLGGGVDGEVFAILVEGDDVYVGGSFSHAGGVAATNLAKWDGSQWIDLGRRRLDADTEFKVTGIIRWGGDLYVTGGGLKRTIFRFDGTTWTELRGPLEIPGNEVGQNSSFVSTPDHLRVLSYRFPDSTARSQGLIETTLSQWDGSAWETTPIDTGYRKMSGHNLTILNRSQLPTPIVSGGSIHFADGADYVDSGDPIMGGKVSPLISRYHLGALPPMEIGNGIVQVHFRTDLNQAKGVAPGRVHRIDRTTDLTGPWETVGYKYATETGGIDFTDEARGFAVYRALPQD